MIEEIRQYVIDRSEAYRRGSEDHYDFWNEHIRYVYQEAVGLAQIYHADKTVVSLGALLHDIALIEKAGDKKDHHLYGKILSNEILNRFSCPEEIKERVLGCVLREVREWMKNAFEKDYQDLSDRTKELFSERYHQITDVVIGSNF